MECDYKAVIWFNLKNTASLISKSAYPIPRSSNNVSVLLDKIAQFFHYHTCEDTSNHTSDINSGNLCRFQVRRAMPVGVRDTVEQMHWALPDSGHAWLLHRKRPCHTRLCYWRQARLQVADSACTRTIFTCNSLWHTCSVLTRCVRMCSVYRKHRVCVQSLADQCPAGLHMAMQYEHKLRRYTLKMDIICDRHFMKRKYFLLTSCYTHTNKQLLSNLLNSGCQRSTNVWG